MLIGPPNGLPTPDLEWNQVESKKEGQGRPEPSVQAQAPSHRQTCTVGSVPSAEEDPTPTVLPHYRSIVTQRGRGTRIDKCNLGYHGGVRGDRSPETEIARTFQSVA